MPPEPKRLAAPPEVPALPAPEHATNGSPESHPPTETAAPPRRRRRSIWPWLVAVLLAAIGIYFLLRPGKPAPAPRVQPAAITAGQSTSGNMNIYVEALGTVTPVNTVTVYSQVTGQLVGVYYQQGQIVHRGDPLVDIDPRPYQAQLTQAEGNLAHDQALLAEARSDLARYRAALAKNAIAAQQVEDQAHLVTQYEGSVKADEGTVSYDQTQLSYTHIVSNINGRVGLRLVDPGNLVFAGSSSPLVVITQMQPITVVFAVAEDDLPQVEAQLRAGHKLAVDALDHGNTKLLATGTLNSLNNQIDTTTGTVKFRADFSNSNLTLFPNQFVNVRLQVNTLRGVTLVPSAAVQYNGTSSFVYVVPANCKVIVQPVTVLSANDTQTAVQGLNPGVSVATSGFDRLESGVLVTVRGQGQSQSQPHATQTKKPPAASVSRRKPVAGQKPGK